MREVAGVSPAAVKVIAMMLGGSVAAGAGWQPRMTNGVMVVVVVKMAMPTVPTVHHREGVETPWVKRGAFQ